MVASVAVLASGPVVDRRRDPAELGHTVVRRDRSSRSARDSRGGRGCHGCVKAVEVRRRPSSIVDQGAAGAVARHGGSWIVDQGKEKRKVKERKGEGRRKPTTNMETSLHLRQTWKHQIRASDFHLNTAWELKIRMRV